ncbi:ester cyclase [Kitasatospora sp. NPDC004531]
MAGGEALARFVAALNAKDLAGMASCLAEEVHHEEPALGWDLHGRSAVLEKQAAGFDALDCVMDVEELIVAGDREILAYRASGTVRRALAGGWPAEAVGRTFRVRGAALARVGPDGRIGHLLFHYDLAGILAQLGAPAADRTAR